MFRYVAATLSSRTKHPLLVSLFGTAVAFVVGGVAVDRLTGNGVATGFFGVYAVIALTLACAGYAVFFGGRLLLTVGRGSDDA